MQCESGNPVLDLVLGFFSFLGDPVGTILNLIAKAVLAAAIAVFGALTTSIPTLTGTTTAKEVNSQSQWLVVYLAVGSSCSRRPAWPWNAAAPRASPR
ncbi:hypothetical protein SHKM778_83370 [Streptomyces sp. KM77-8]|uniref:Uncharacterized protein n=1 Tax=Streptomyces haneummycinicus TaxID=3074435 RepID=A0AAT9HXI5_9ACTN